KAKHEKKITGKWAHPIMYWALPGRPHMLFIEDSRFVDVEGIRFDNSPVYTGWIARSHHLNFMNLRVNNRGDMPNSDGFHFGSCSYVNIVGCDFICGDDCIAIDSCQYGDSHHFTITGCTFDGTVNVFRIFTGIDARDKKDYPKHDVHDISASSCSCNASGIFNLTAENGDIYNISMTGFTINTDKERLGNCAFLMTWNGRIYDCIFSDITARHNGAITIMGEEGYTVEKITFNNWRVCIMPMEKGYGIDMPSEPLCANYAIHHYAPYNMYLRYAKDIRFSEVDMYWDERGNVSEPIPAMKIDRCEDIFTDTFRGKGYLGAKSIEII
ncbi:MAG: hypothetical protein GX633_06385, partial [Clostridiales bacterium]|nr:hypothetical protein [Clostridiales bacterium]